MATAITIHQIAVIARLAQLADAVATDRSGDALAVDACLAIGTIARDVAGNADTAVAESTLALVGRRALLAVCERLTARE